MEQSHLMPVSITPSSPPDSPNVTAASSNGPDASRRRVPECNAPYAYLARCTPAHRPPGISRAIRPGGHEMPGAPGPVGKDRYDGGHHCDTGRDQGDLPTRHAPGDDGMDGGHGNDAALAGVGWRQASQCGRCRTTESKQRAAHDGQDAEAAADLLHRVHRGLLS